uniref:RING-type domain-containing protein n=1 Tax=viral metagenome TaxID=1070528 RepID=A0A6C0B0D7_9ZZZZ
MSLNGRHSWPIRPYEPLNQQSLFSLNDNRLNRNFEELITERGEEVSSAPPPPQKSMFADVFENIREKIFIMNESDDMEITESDKVSFQEKYKTQEVQSTIQKVKEQISQLYVKKIEYSIMIQERRRQYASFCEHITNSITSIENLQLAELRPEDIQLKTILLNRVNTYYEDLEIDHLIDCEYKIKTEFEFLKKTLIGLSSVSLTMCTICMEKQIEWFVDPCGHTLCDDCKSKTEKLKTCHYCRTQKTKFSRLYL